MSKLSSQLKITDSIRVKSFDLGGHAFKVKVPLSSEMETMTEKVTSISDDQINIRFEKMLAGLKKEPSANIEILDNDVMLDGKPLNLRNTCSSVIQMEQRILEYFKLLIPESGDFSDITYADIEAEFPMAIQFEMLEKITEAIQPGYKEARKN